MEKIACPYCGRRFEYSRTMAKEAISRAGESEARDEEIREMLLELKHHLMKEQEYISRRLTELEMKKAERVAALASIDEASAQLDMDERQRAKDLLRSYGWDLDL